MPLSEPFFNQAADLARTNHPSEFETEIAYLEQSATRLPSVTPSCVIFHMSRCGSTLVANALRARGGTVVLGESVIFEQMMSWAGSPSTFWRQIARRLIPAVTSIFAHYQGFGAQQIVIKCGTEGAYSMPGIRAVWPDVPCLILIRNPVEVLVSNLNNPPRWLTEWFNEPMLPRRSPPAEVVNAGPAELCAWALGQLCRHLCTVIDARCRVLDYSELSIPTVTAIAEAFTIPFADDVDLSSVFSFHAKRPRRKFEDDSGAKQTAASDAIRAAAARWIDEPYSELLACSRSSRPNR